MSPQLAVVGNLIVDDAVFENGETRFEQAGGAALYTALGAAPWGVSVGVVSVIGTDYPQSVLARLEKMKIDLAGVRVVDGRSLRIWLLYEGRRRQVVHRLDAPAHAAMSPGVCDLPNSWRPSAYHLAPMPLAVQADWLERLGETPGALTALDPFALVNEGSLDSIRAAFHHADVVLLSEDELLLDGALESPKASLERLAQTTVGASSRLRYLLLKRGAQGGLAYELASQTFEQWPARAAKTVDSTGAGDAFAGGLLAGLARGKDLDQSLEQGVVSASFALEGRGAEVLLAVSPTDFRNRRRQWFGAGEVA